MCTVVDIDSGEDFDRVIETSQNRVIVIYFWAEWAPQCKQMNDVIQEICQNQQFEGATFLKIEAESLPNISEKYNVTSVPTFVFIQQKDIVDKVFGANVPELMKKLRQYLAKVLPIPEQRLTKENLNNRLKHLINKSHCMLFMKGTAVEPKCGFSRQIVELLDRYNAQYCTFDIISDEEVRQGLKDYSNWPTYPQLYIQGELIGGLDIVKEMSDSGELEKLLPRKDINQRLKNLINKSPVMVFMKGNPEGPRCGFSKSLVEILNNTGISYEAFDILQDEEVRQGLKTYSNWPTYPQIYVKGNLIGGLDIIKELQDTGELKCALQGS